MKCYGKGLAHLSPKYINRLIRESLVKNANEIYRGVKLNANRIVSRN